MWVGPTVCADDDVRIDSFLRGDEDRWTFRVNGDNLRVQLDCSTPSFCLLR